MSNKNIVKLSLLGNVLYVALGVFGVIASAKDARNDWKKLKSIGGGDQ